MEEELRSAKAKYEESSEDVYRRMLDIKEAESDSIVDLGTFLDAELNYYDRAREVLMQLKRDWPGYVTLRVSVKTIADKHKSATESVAAPRRGPRSRTNTMGSLRNVDEEDLPPLMPIRSRVSSNHVSAQNSPRRELPGFDFSSNLKPTISRNSTFEGPTSLQRDASPASPISSKPRLSRAPTESSILGPGGRLQLLPVRTRDSAPDVFGDENDESTYGDYDSRSASPAPSYASGASRSMSAGWARQDGVMGGGARKMAPPPPPSKTAPPNSAPSSPKPRNPSPATAVPEHNSNNNNNSTSKHNPSSPPLPPPPRQPANNAAN